MSLGKSLIKNWLSLLGSVIVAGAFFIFLLLFVVDILFGHSGPFFDAVAYLMMPAALFAGVGLIILGYIASYWWSHRDSEAAKECKCPIRAFFVCKKPDMTVDFGKCSTWSFVICLVLILAIMGGVGAMAGLKIFHWTEADEFCGQLCHVMAPEDETHAASSHANVKCVDCHVGPGVEAYAVAKLNGTRQLMHTLTGKYPRPIHVPVSAMYAKHLDGKTKIEHTCLECHPQNANRGSKLKNYVHYMKNEEDLKFTTQMTFNLAAIHNHVAPGNLVEFATKDGTRNGEISWVRMTPAEGPSKTYAKGDFKVVTGETKVFTMTCLECHNRVAHQYADPVTAVDLAMELGTLNPELGDNVKMTVVDVLAEQYDTEKAAMEAIATTLTDTYEGSEYLEAAIKTVQDIYKRNMYPAMKATWAAYPDYIGHKNTEGCARCHTDKLECVEGDTEIPTDCNTCHLVISQSKEDDFDEADVKGLTFQHPDGSEKDDISNCSRCHDGTY